MKNFIVEIEFSHESFGGYDHKDGTRQYEVKAKTADSARNKALKLARKGAGAYDTRVISVFRVY